MRQERWVTIAASGVETGDRLRLPSGTEMTVSRIETAFLGHDDLVCFIEDSDDQWLAQAMGSNSDIEVMR